MRTICSDISFPEPSCTKKRCSNVRPTNLPELNSRCAVPSGMTWRYFPRNLDAMVNSCQHRHSRPSQYCASIGGWWDTWKANSYFFTTIITNLNDQSSVRDTKVWDQHQPFHIISCPWQEPTLPPQLSNPQPGPYINWAILVHSM